MIYMGGKSRLAKHIVPFLLRHNPEVIIEPFVGGANITSEILKQGYEGRLILSDLDASLMCMWYHVIYEGWLPTLEDYPSREQYNEWRAAAKRGEVPECNALRGWARTNAAFSGNPWSSYTKNEVREYKSGQRHHYAQERVNTSTRQFNLLHEHAEQIELHQCGYEAYEPCNPLRGWARTGASHSGKPWGGYMKNEERVHSTQGHKMHDSKERVNTSTEQFNLLHEHAESITLACCGYEAHTPHIPTGAVVYVDPPYANTAAYDTEEFSHTHLWETLRAWAQAGAHIYVSEQSKPDWVNAEVAWEKIVNRGIGRKATDQGGGVTEKLYYLAPGE